MNLMTAEQSRRHRGGQARPLKPKLMPSSFRGLPGVMEPLQAYMERNRRTLNGQLDIIFDNALQNPEQVMAIGRECLSTKEYATAASEVSPRSFRIDQAKLQRIREEVRKCDVGLSDWVNMAIYYCIKTDQMEPR